MVVNRGELSHAKDARAAIFEIEAEGAVEGLKARTVTEGGVTYETPPGKIKGAYITPDGVDVALNYD